MLQSNTENDTFVKMNNTELVLAYISNKVFSSINETILRKFNELSSDQITSNGVTIYDDVISEHDVTTVDITSSHTGILETVPNVPKGDCSINLSQWRIPRSYPAYYYRDQCIALNYTGYLYECEKPGAVILFGTFVVLLGVAAIFGNSLLPLMTWKYRYMKNRQNYIKVSLAFNDMIAGFILLFSVLPNVIWFRNSTESEVHEKMVCTFNSPIAIISASAMIISLQGSLLHLMFLSADRFIAIRWPMMHRSCKNTSTVYWLLFAIWMVTLSSSGIPAAFPSHFSFLYNPQVFLYTLGYDGNETTAHGLLHFGLVLFIPYVATIVLTMFTGAVALKKLKSFQPSYATTKHRGTIVKSCKTKTTPMQRSVRISGDNLKRQEQALAKTIIIMVVAFTLAWSIFFVIFFLSHDSANQGDETTSVIYMVSFYSGLSNSVCNVIIYSLRDKNFRTAVATTFRRKSKTVLYRRGSSISVETRQNCTSLIPNV